MIGPRQFPALPGDGYLASKAKRIGPQNNPMIRLGLEPITPF